MAGSSILAVQRRRYNLVFSVLLNNNIGGERLFVPFSFLL